MKEVETKDGSKTYYNEEYSETYHSTTGAVEEAFEKYINASDVDKLAHKRKVRILDVCFGLGYNTAAAIDRIWQINPSCQIEATCLENDEKILLKIPELTPAIKSYGYIKKVVENKYQFSDNHLKIRIVLGDARKTILALRENYDLIFHDPFSPKKCPELWSEDFFKEEKRLLAHDGVLTTYSCAKSVRENLTKAGFVVLDGPCIGRRSPSTVAKPNHF